MTRRFKFLNFCLLIAICTAIATFHSCDPDRNSMGNNNSLTHDEGVVINGIKWATRNVDKPGTFAANPEDAGMIYQWNRKVGWGATDPMINSTGGTDWDDTILTGDAWIKTNDPSPAGWRVPTSDEIKTLFDTNKVRHVWTSINGVNGRRFIDKATGNSLFLPAAGNRFLGDGTLYYADMGGIYWSSTAYEIDGELAYYMGFDRSVAVLYDSYRHVGLSLRAVAE